MKKIKIKDKVRMMMMMNLRKIMITFLLLRKVLNFVMNLKINRLIVYNMTFNLVTI